MPLAKFNLDKQIDAALPFLFPLPAAWTVYTNLREMDFPPVIAFSGAAGVELFGLRAARLSTRMKDHNDSHKNKTEIKLFSAPTWQTYALSVAYLLITGAIIFSIKGFSFDSLIIFSFPVFSLSGGFFSGLASDQNKRESERKTSRNKGKPSASSPKQEATPQDKQKKKSQVARKKPRKTKQKGKVNVKRLLALYNKNPRLRNVDAARKFGIERGEAIAQWKKKLIASGEIEIVDGAVIVK